MNKKKLVILNTDEFAYSYGGVCQFKRNMDKYFQSVFDVEYLVMPMSAFKKCSEEKFSFSGRFMAMLPGPRRLRYFLFLLLNYRHILKSDFVLSHGPEGSFLTSFSKVPFAHVYHGNSNPMSISKFWFGCFFEKLYEKIGKRIDNTCPLVYTVGPPRNSRQKKINNPLYQNISPLPIRKRKGFVFVGRLETMKNVDRLIKIYSQLPLEIRKENPFYIAGYGTQEEKLKDIARSISIVDNAISSENHANVIFLGKVDTEKVLEMDSTKKILIMASVTEGMPTAIAEAFSVGLPVVSTAVGDIPSVVRNGVNGQLLPLDYKDEEYIEAINKILANYEFYSDKAYESSKIFNAENVTRGVINDINEILNVAEKTII